MESASIAAWVQELAAVLTFFAAGIAVVATLKAPERAARLAEDLRAQNELAEARRLEKYRIFRTLMDHRGRDISAAEPVNALNMIDIVFHDEKHVRSAFANFLRYINGAENRRERIEAYIEIVVEIAKALGFSKDLTKADIDRGYFPLS